MNRRGSFRDVFLILIVLFGLGIGTLVGLKTLDATIDAMSGTTIGENVKANESMHNVQTIAENYSDYIFMGVFFALLIGLIVTAYFAGGHPVFAIIYFIALIIMGFLAAVLQYVWEQLSGSALFITYAAEMPLANWILTHLVAVMAGVGLVGMLFMYIGHSVNEGGGI
jgi:cobalamin biosynthesis protein CobD/CbiB